MPDSSTYPSHQRRTTICAFQPTACDVCIDCQNAFVEHGRAELRATVERLTRERDEAIRQRVDDVQAAQDRAEAFVTEHVEKLDAAGEAERARLRAGVEALRDQFDGFNLFADAATANAAQLGAEEFAADVLALIDGEETRGGDDA